MSIIEISNLHKTYNSGKNNAVYALKGLDIAIEKGESVAIMGVSGSGKSTLLHIIGCLDGDFSQGEYSIAGKLTEGLSARSLADIRNNTIGFILQDWGLILNNTVFDNVKLPLVFSSKFEYKAIKSRTLEIINTLGIGDKAKVKVRELSGGQKQRVAIARAMVNDPDIILADEPTSALDSTTASEIMEVLLGLNKLGKTIIVVTHDISVAKKMSRIVNIVDGKIV